MSLNRRTKTSRAAFVFGVVLATLVPVQDIHGQAEATSLYESRFAEANGIRIQYMDFGGSGLPLVVVQDVHNYFEDEEPYFRDLWSEFYARFTDNHRVIAVVRRGYGESDSPDFGYDVPTQSEDLLALMDALGIRRAVLFGRTIATQDMTWIAEHHPARVAGLVYLGNPPVFTSLTLPDAKTFSDLLDLASCDLQERASTLLTPRTSWRPHFLRDETARISVRGMRFFSPVYDRKSRLVLRMERLESNLNKVDSLDAGCPGEEPYISFVRELAKDVNRRKAIRQAFEAADLSVEVDVGIVRAFGSNLESIQEPENLDDWRDFFGFMLPHMRRFLQDIAESK